VKSASLTTVTDEVEQNTSSGFVSLSHLPLKGKAMLRMTQRIFTSNANQ